MRFMFNRTSYNGDISRWKIQDSCATNNMFRECPIQEEHKPTGGNPEYESEDEEGDYEVVSNVFFTFSFENSKNSS